jgi:hypothetical protein
MNLLDKYGDGEGLVKHALSEFKYAGWMDETGMVKDEMQELICDNVLELLLKMEGQGHSGFSAGYLVNLFNRLSKFEVITPLKGTEDEWGCVFDETDGTRQNRRDSRVFKRGDGFTYFLEGRVFRNKGTHNCFTCKASATFVSFPCIPQTEYIDIEEEDLSDELIKEYVEKEEMKWKNWLNTSPHGGFAANVQTD